MNKNVSAQAAIEFLILLAAAFSFLAVFSGMLKTVFLTGVFALDVQKAENFLSEFEKKSHSLMLFGEGSSFDISENFFTQWSVFSEGNKLIVEVKSPELGKSKRLEAELPASVIAGIFNKNKNLSLKVLKQKDSFLVKDNKPDF